MSEEQIAEIAAGLTKAQRAAIIISASGGWMPPFPEGTGWFGKSLRRKGLTHDGVTIGQVLTPLGFEIRAVLLAEKEQAIGYYTKQDVDAVYERVRRVDFLQDTRP